jgi:hypothetical protein
MVTRHSFHGVAEVSVGGRGPSIFNFSKPLHPLVNVLMKLEAQNSNFKLFKIPKNLPMLRVASAPASEETVRG